MSLDTLQLLSREIRARVVRTSHRASVPHLGSCLSCVDILVSCYFEILNIDPDKPTHPNRDRFILSKGHAAPALFQVLAKRGFFPLEQLEHFGADGSYFGEHPPAPGYLSGVEAATGSLGHGMPMALGMALAARIKHESYRVVALLSDGECNEGSIWESAMLAASQKVSNLAVVVDFNKWQATGRSQQVMALDPLRAKWEAFGWATEEIDGHDHGAITEALRPVESRDKPTAVIAHTVKGKGVSFMEDDNNWHYRTPSAEELDAALAELGIDSNVLGARP